MRTSIIMTTLAGALLSGCVTDGGGDGFITHSSYRTNADEELQIRVALSTKTKSTALVLSGLRSSESLADDTVTVCGYVSGQNATGNRFPAVLFGGQFPRGGSTFVVFEVPGQGQDPQRIAAVRAICAANEVNV